MFYIHNNEEVVQVGILSENITDYLDGTYVDYCITFRDIVKTGVSREMLHRSITEAKDVLANTLRKDIEYLKGQVVKLEDRLKDLEDDG